MMEGDLNFKSDVAWCVLQTVLNTGKFKALNDNEKEQIADVYKTGTVLGRALASRRLSLLDMNDIHSMQAHVNALVAKLQKQMCAKLRTLPFSAAGDCSNSGVFVGKRLFNSVSIFSFRASEEIGASARGFFPMEICLLPR